MLKKQDHVHWGTFATTSVLPNVSGSPNTSSDLAAGDLAFVTGDVTYQCTNPSVGSAVWGPVGGGVSSLLSILGVSYTYTQAATPVEEVVGNGAFNGGLVGNATAYFKAAITNVWQNPGSGETTRLRLYDMGTAAGPPGSPRLVYELTATYQGGPRSNEQALTVVAASPTTGEILDTDRMYEVAVIQDVSDQGDVAFIGSVGIEVR